MSYVTMGDLICIQGDGEIGDVLVTQLKAIYSNAKSSVQSQYRGAYQAIVSSYDEVNKGTRWPFAPMLCQLKGIGLQAQELSQKISQADGASALPSAAITPSVTDSIANAVNAAGGAASTVGQIGKYALYGAVGLGGLYIYMKYIKKEARR